MKPTMGGMSSTICFAWSGKVVHVANGDTITILKEDEEIIVRLYDIDTPEKSQWYGQNAKAFTSSQVMGKTVDVQVIDTGFCFQSFYDMMGSK